MPRFAPQSCARHRLQVRLQERGRSFWDTGEAAAAALTRRDPGGLGVGYIVFNRLCAEDGGVDTIDAVARPIPPCRGDNKPSARGVDGAGAAFYSDSFALRGCRTKLFALVSTVLDCTASL